LKFLLARVRRAMRERRQRSRFPLSVVHAGAVVGDSSSMGDYAVLFRDSVLLNSALGAYSYVQAASAIYNADIGPFCSIAGAVKIGLASHPTAMVCTNPVFYDHEQPLPKFFTSTRLFTHNLPRTVIAADVWLGEGVMVKAGVRIGVGAVIGAGAVVTKDVAPYVIAAGNPCRTIRLRFAEDVCSRLLASRWWELGEADLQRLAPLFVAPESLLAELEQVR
jgi:acetyltransferase-like isoleucine patch superfamily enzyme